MKIVQRTLPLLSLVFLVGCSQTPTSLVDNYFAKLKNGETSAAKKQLCSLTYNDSIAIPLTSYTLGSAQPKFKDSVKYYEVDATVSTTYKQGGTPYTKQSKDPFSGMTFPTTNTFQQRTPDGGYGATVTIGSTITTPDRIVEEQVYPAVPITKMTIEVWKSDDFFAEVIKLDEARKAQGKAEADARQQKMDEERARLGMSPSPIPTVGETLYVQSSESKRKSVSSEPLCIVYPANWSNSPVGKFVHPSGIFQLVQEK
jgi:hypothetical protein